MADNHFVFADLSTYDIETAQHFYSQVFDWEYSTEDGSYFMATHDQKEIAGIYETPQRFKDINMPSFWMSYIQVESVTETVAKAKILGGSIELVDTENIIGGIALIRDPLGAGFTIYEGAILKHRYQNKTNALIWNELFVSNHKKIKPFYEGIFNWKIIESSDARFDILDSQQNTIGNINVVDNTMKGKYEYWWVFFGVHDTAVTKKRALKNGGSLIYEDEHLTALADPFGAFFHVIPLDKSSSVPKQEKSKSSLKWKAVLGLGLVMLYFSTGWSWIWAIFFAFWVIMDIRSGQTHLFEPVPKQQNPVLYWVIVVMWAVLGVVSLLYYTNTI